MLGATLPYYVNDGFFGLNWSFSVLLDPVARM